MLTGTGNGTSPNNIVWFCHLCNWSGVLPSGYYHQCKPLAPNGVKG